jgi:DNA-binding MurR/RpiR family transcriptional regulator
MSGALIAIRSIYGNLTNSEQKVADHILKSPSDIPLMSVSQLAENTGVSVASVSRLSKKVGYRSFQELKIEVAKGADNPINDIYSQIKPEDNNHSVIEKVFSGNILSLQETQKILNVPDLIKVAKCISEARQVIFFGIGSSGHIAADSALRFKLLDIQAEAYFDPQQIIIEALRMKKHDIAIGFSHSGRSKFTIQALKLAAKSGAKTVGVANYIGSPIQKVSDIFLCTSFSENRVKVAALSSRIAQICIMDCVYLLTARFKKQLKKTSVFNEYAERLLRFPEK